MQQRAAESMIQRIKKAADDETLPPWGRKMQSNENYLSLIEYFTTPTITTCSKSIMGGYAGFQGLR